MICPRSHSHVNGGPGTKLWSIGLKKPSFCSLGLTTAYIAPMTGDSLFPNSISFKSIYFNLMKQLKKLWVPSTGRSNRSIHTVPSIFCWAVRTGELCLTLHLWKRYLSAAALQKSLNSVKTWWLLRLWWKYYMSNKAVGKQEEKTQKREVKSGTFWYACSAGIQQCRPHPPLPSPPKAGPSESQNPALPWASYGRQQTGWSSYLDSSAEEHGVVHWDYGSWSLPWLP